MAGGSVVGRGKGVQQNPGGGEGVAHSCICGGFREDRRSTLGKPGRRRPQKGGGARPLRLWNECPARREPGRAQGQQGASAAGKGCGQRSSPEAPWGCTRARVLQEGRREQAGEQGGCP